MIPLDRISDHEVAALGRKASGFLRAHPWCMGIYSAKVAWVSPGFLGVFLFKIIPAGLDVEDTLWTISGDIPSAYLVCDNAPTWRDALFCYVWEMRRWVDAVRSGASLERVIPVSAAPTLENAQLLSTRLNFIHNRILRPGYRVRR